MVDDKLKLVAYLFVQGKNHALFITFFHEDLSKNTGSRIHGKLSAKSMEMDVMFSIRFLVDQFETGLVGLLLSSPRIHI